jgi:hypothetical protein
MRFSMLVISAVLLTGCYRQPPTPTLRPIAKITARVYAVPDLGFSAIDFVEVPQEHLPAFANLITPIEPCIQTIDPSMHYHVADVFIEHQDGSTTTLVVRWTGHNPAALSLDDRNYYYGGSDAFPDGATRIIRLLNEYHHRSQIGKGTAKGDVDR